MYMNIILIIIILICFLILWKLFYIFKLVSITAYDYATYYQNRDMYNFIIIYDSSNPSSQGGSPIGFKVIRRVKLPGDMEINPSTNKEWLNSKQKYSLF